MANFSADEYFLDIGYISFYLSVGNFQILTTDESGGLTLRFVRKIRK